MRTHKDHGYLMLGCPPSQEERDQYYRTAYINPTPMHDPGRAVRIVSRFFEQPGHMLDVGCGEGTLLRAFAAQGWEVAGVDPGPVVAPAGITIFRDTLSGAMDKLGTYDLVVMANLLEHLVDPEEAVKQAYDLLLPNGLLYCSVPNDFSPLQKTVTRERNLREWWVTPDHLNYFSFATLRHLLEASAFTCVCNTTDFPMELFLLLGWNYVDDPEMGKAMHLARCNFEAAMASELTERIYKALSCLEIGRSVIVCGRKQL